MKYRATHAPNKKRRVTIQDVADHLDLSKATISLALNGSPLVADSTKARVKQAAKELGYRVNYFASRLSRGNSSTIGLFILGGETNSIWTLPSSWIFYHPIIMGVTSQLSAKGYRLQLELIPTEDALNGQVIAETIQEGYLDGIILVVQENICYDFVNSAVEMEFPFVVLNARLPHNVSSVKIDNEAGSRKAVEYLLGLGHERIGYVSGPAMDLNAMERREGFCKAFKTAKLRVRDDYLMYGDWQIQSGEILAKELMSLSERPSAILCANDHMAIGAVRALKALGFRIPEQISIIGFDDNEFCRITTPCITTVRQPLDIMGEVGAQEVLRQISDGVSMNRHTSLETEVVIRESTAPPLGRTSR